MLYTPDSDTIPSNTLSPIDAIINPQNIDVDSKLITPAYGTRYLLLHGIGTVGSDSAIAWNQPIQLIANANDIIEYNGKYWSVVFDSRNSGEQLHYVTNLKTGAQYRWYKSVWSKSVDGQYDANSWEIAL